MALPTLDQLQPAAAPAAAPQAAPQDAPRGDPATGDGLATVIAALQLGDPGAVYLPLSQFGDKYAEAKPRIDAALPKLGLGSVETASGNVVYFNPKVVTPQQIEEADKAGSLDSVAVSLASDAAAPAASPATSPDVVGGLTGNTAPAPAGQPAGAATALADERAANVTPQPPSKRALPSSGILDGLAKRAI